MVYQGADKSSFSQKELMKKERGKRDCTAVFQGLMFASKTLEGRSNAIRSNGQERGEAGGWSKKRGKAHESKDRVQWRPVTGSKTVPMDGSVAGGDTQEESISLSKRIRGDESQRRAGSLRKTRLFSFNIACESVRKRGSGPANGSWEDPNFFTTEMRISAVGGLL